MNKQLVSEMNTEEVELKLIEIRTVQYINALSIC